MTDWAVWPIFLIQVIAFILLLFPKTAEISGIHFKTISLSLLFISCAYIAVSLFADSSDVLNLYF